jgi:hypothetical protein
MPSNPEGSRQSPGGTCGCGYELCCGQCVCVEDKERIQKQDPNVEFTHCSDQCSCGGIPTFLKMVLGDKEP